MSYKNFRTSIYCTQYDIEAIEDIQIFASQIQNILKYMDIDKFYLETIRSEQLVDDIKIREVKAYVNSIGIKTSGGITLNANYNKGFKSLCYSNKKHMKTLEYAISYTAGLFDEVILDDFYFTNCRCKDCIASKGERSWTEFRVDKLRETSEWIMEIAKKRNPNAVIIIKYPNWYEDYQRTGYDLIKAPDIFDRVYTGTEVRNSKYTQQSLQPYLSYFLMRYLDNVSNNRNNGGWFDTFDCTSNLNIFLHQLNLTLFAKAKESTMFCLGMLTGYNDVFIPLAGYAYERIDKILGELGNPCGISCYKPHNSCGENYIHNYIGMLGIPIEATDKFDDKESTIILTASAAYDNQIISKIKNYLQQGGNIIMTSGLIDKLSKNDNENQLTQLCEVYYTDRKADIDIISFDTQICAFANYSKTAKDITIPQIEFSTNDVWQHVCGISGEKSYPILLSTSYGCGKLCIITIPDDFCQLYDLPKDALDYIRDSVMYDRAVRIHAPSKVSLFTYDNGSFVIQSFLDHKTYVDIIIKKDNSAIVDILTNEKQTGINIDGETHIRILQEARTYTAYRIAD